MTNVLVFEVIPPRSEDGIQEVVGLETVMQSLVLSDRLPIALEIAGSATRKQFLVRATDSFALTHAEQQLRLRYPQADIRYLSEADDPLQLRASEAVSIAELRPGAAVYLPMREWEPEVLQQQKGIDPLLGMLAALSSVPEGHRAVAQIALVPASPTWSKAHQRKGIEHALDPERVRRQQELAMTRHTDGVPSTAGLILLGLMLLLLLVWQYMKPAIPDWLWQTGIELVMHGRLPALTEGQRFQLFAGIAIIFVVLNTIAVGILLLKRIFAKPVYNQRLVAVRTGRMAYRGRIRLIVIGPCAGTQSKTQRRKETQTRRTVLSSLVAAYRQFHTADAGYFVPRMLKDRSCECLLSLVEHKNTRLPGWARGIGRSNHFFTPDFLSSAWRLPGRADLGDLTGMVQKRARSLPLPPALYRGERGQPIGDCSHGGITHPFAIPPGFFGNHTFLGGKSGEGKSTLMVHLVRAVIEEGQRGFFLLDPHGDLADDVLRVIPRERFDDVVLIDLGDPDFCVGLNPLDVTLGRDRDLVVSALISVFSHIWKTAWGPRMEAPFRSAILTLLEANTVIVERDPLHGPDQQYTLLAVMQVLTDESFCHDLLEMTNDKFIHRFWYEYYSPLNLVQQRDRIDPVMTKMMQFESKIARRILGQSRSTIRLHEMVQEQKLVIVRLAFSEAGVQTGSLIGATFLGLLMVTLREQSRLPQEERARMVMFLDEFQSFGASADLSQLLAELRKYGGSAVLATQSLEYLTALDPVLLPTVQANTKQYLLFRLSATDAASIAQELDIAPADLVNLDSHTCYVRLVYAGQQQPTFSLCLQRPVLEVEAQLIVLRDLSQRKYCLRAADVEQQLIEALGKAIAASMQRQQEEKTKREVSTYDGVLKDTSTEEGKQGAQFSKSRGKRKKGQVTSFDQHPYQDDQEHRTTEEGKQEKIEEEYPNDEEETEE